MANTGAASTYLDPANRESLLDVITNISPIETQLYTGLQRSTASQPRHEWVEDTLNAAATNAVDEGSDAGNSGNTNPSRNANYTQIVRKVYEVTDTERATDSAGFSDRLAYEMTKAMKEWKNDAEFALMRSALASGNNSTARSMNGVKSAISTHATTHSGVSLSETMLNTYFENVWNSGGNVDEVYVDGTLKRRISGFTGGATKNVDVEDKRLVNSVDVYESDFGLVKVFLHRHVTVSGDTDNDIIGIQSDKWAVAHLREPQRVPLAKVGSATREMIEGEFTLECRAEAANFITKQLK